MSPEAYYGDIPTLLYPSLMFPEMYLKSILIYNFIYHKTFIKLSLYWNTVSGVI